MLKHQMEYLFDIPRCYLVATKRARVHTREMKRFIFLFTLVLAMGVIPAAHAEEINIDRYVTINYSATVKLNKTGCQSVAFKYVTDEEVACHPPSSGVAMRWSSQGRIVDALRPAWAN